MVTNAENSTEELIPSGVLVPILMRHKTRTSLAAALVTKLVDVETRIRSNVRGRCKKDQLDTNIISFVKGNALNSIQVRVTLRKNEMIVSKLSTIKPET